MFRLFTTKFIDFHPTITIQSNMKNIPTWKYPTLSIIYSKFYTFLTNHREADQSNVMSLVERNVDGWFHRTGVISYVGATKGT